MKRLSIVLSALFLLFIFCSAFAGGCGKENCACAECKEQCEGKLDYGFKNSPVKVHVFMNTAMWNFGDQFLGDYANTGGSYAGRPLFITYSGYVSLSAHISKQLYAQAEFELYKGETGGIKVCRLRQVWKPSPYFKLSLGRDFPAIGIQDKVYYPTSRFNLLPLAPYTYLSVLRATGWWDSGIHMSANYPFYQGWKAKANLSIINGPGDLHLDSPYLLPNLMKPNTQGYMYESFHNSARQPWDNNDSKHVAMRLAVCPRKDLEVGGSYMFGKYDRNDKFDANYLFAHLLYGGEKLTVAAEYGQLVAGVRPANFGTDTSDGKWNNNWSGTVGAKEVTQYSYYISCGYKLLMDKYVHCMEPVIRYEFMDSWKEDRENKGDRNVIWFGFRVSPIKHWLLKAAYMIQSEEYADLDNDGFIIESVMEF